MLTLYFEMISGVSEHFDLIKSIIILLHESEWWLQYY